APRCSRPRRRLCPAANARRASQRSVRRSRVAVRAEVRRVSLYRQPGRLPSANLLPARRGRDRGISRPGARAARAARGTIRCRRRDRGAGRHRPARLPAAAEARAADGAARRGSGRRRVARDAVPFRSARLRGLRSAIAPAGRAQEAAAAPGARGGTDPRRRARRRPWPRPLRQRARARARGHRREARPVRIPARAVSRLAEGPHRLRQPTFLRFRKDKAPAECIEPGTPPVTLAPREVPFSNLEKIFWPEEGYTKGDLIDYYRAISSWLMPYLRDRPVVLTRYPDGIAGKSFFQKDAPDYVPAWVRTARVWSEEGGRDIDFFICEDVDT